VVGRLVTALALAVVVAACAGQSVGPTPSGSQPAGDGWQLLGNFPAGGAAQVNSIVASAVGFIAVGTRSDEGADCPADLNHGRVWSTSDGQTWASLPDDAFAQTDLTQLVSFRDSLYAFGTSGTFDDETGCGDVANPAGVNVWRSADAGATWQQLAQAPEIARASIGEVVVAGDRLLLVGSRTDQDGNDQAATWSSPDAQAWTRAELPPATSFLGSAAARDNVVVGFGFDEDFPLPWITRDGGGHWYEESIDVSGGQTDEGELGLGIEDVIATSGGYVAVGQACCSGTAQILPLTLSTADGTQWQGAPVASDVPQAMRRISQLPASLLAVGVRTYLDEAPPAGELGGRSWTSADGKAWLAGPSFFELGDGNVTAMAVGSGGVVVAGTTFTVPASSAGDTGLRMWFAPLSAFAGGTSN
jgi:hypothetical protein